MYAKTITGAGCKEAKNLIFTLLLLHLFFQVVVAKLVAIVLGILKTTCAWLELRNC
jgi:hypothetical protein